MKQLLAIISLLFVVAISTHCMAEESQYKSDTVIAEYNGDQVVFRHPRLVFNLYAEKDAAKTMTLEFSYDHGTFRTMVFVEAKNNQCKACEVKRELLYKTSSRVYDRSGEFTLGSLDIWSKFSRHHVVENADQVIVFGMPSLHGSDWTGNDVRDAKMLKGWMDVYPHAKLLDFDTYYSEYLIQDIPTKAIQFLKYEDSLPTAFWSRTTTELIGAKIYDDQSVLVKDAVEGLFFIDTNATITALSGGGELFKNENSIYMRDSESVRVGGKNAYRICVSIPGKAYPTCAFYNVATKELSAEISDVFEWSLLSAAFPAQEIHALQLGPHNTLRALCTKDFNLQSVSPLSGPHKEKFLRDVQTSNSGILSLATTYGDLDGVQIVDDILKKTIVDLKCTEPVSAVK